MKPVCAEAARIQSGPGQLFAVEPLERRRLLASIVVNSLSDATGLPNGQIDLREAINTANTATTPTTITFDPIVFNSNKTILLSGGVLELKNTKQPTTITGPAAGVTVNGNQKDGVFHVFTGVNLSLTALTITGGIGIVDYVGRFEGGGIFNDGTTTLTNVTVSGNSASDYGGGIFNDDGKMTLTNVNVSGNVSQGQGFGGGISNVATITLTNVTVSGNVSQSGFGGGLFNQGQMTLINSAVSGNSQGIYDADAGEYDNTALGNCIVAGNSGPDVTGNFASFGNNLIGKTDGSSGWASNDITGTADQPKDPKLGTLANNGGPTQTMLPEPGSPAIDHGNNKLVPSGIKTDQRGLKRIYNGTVDIGAVEVQPIPTVTVTAPPSYDAVHHHVINYYAFAAVSSAEPLGSFASSNATGPYTVDVNWGDSTADTIFTQAAIGAIAGHPHTFTNIGFDTITIRVRDSTGIGVGSGKYVINVSKAVNTFNGQVYSDANKNGKQDSKELGLSGITVYDDVNNNGALDTSSGELSTVTDSAGLWTLIVSGTGSAVIRQVLPQNISQITPANKAGVHITLTGTLNQLVTFGDHNNSLSQQLYFITGEVFSDANSNGKLNAGENGIAGVTIYDDLNNNEKLDSGEASVISDVSGNYSFIFDAGAPSPAILRQVIPGGASQTLPTGGMGLHVTIGAASNTGMNFGDHVPIYIFKGNVYFDGNKNGKQDSAERGMSGWEVYDDVNNNHKLDAGEPTKFTDSKGNYTIGLSGLGSIVLRQILPANWSQITPTGGLGQHLTLPPTTTSGFNFGNYTSVKYLSTVATTNSLVGWWTFDGSANSLVNGYTGTLEGGANLSTLGAAPISGDTGNRGLSLNGANSFVDTSLTTQQSFTTSATYNVWVNLGSTPAAGSLYTIAAKSQFGNDLDLFVGAGGQIYFYTDNGTSTSFTPNSLTGWHMVTAEFDTVARTRKIFWDGQLAVQTNPYTGTHSASTGTFSIGESDVFTGRFFDGEIDEVSLWNRALTASEVLAIFKSASGN